MTTAKHFEIFKREVDKWLDILSLKRWEIRFEHHDLKDNHLAETQANAENMIAFIRLNTIWEGTPISNQAVKNSAKHEAMHIFMAKYRYLARHRSTYMGEIDEEEHGIVEVLVKVL